MILSTSVTHIVVLAGMMYGSAPDTVPAVQSPPILKTISTDTGAFAPGRRDFTRYNTPGLCLSAAIGAYDAARRSLAVRAVTDTSDARYDTVGTAGARTVLKSCLSRAGLADTGSQDNMLRFSVALRLQDDEGALLALARLTEQDTTRENRVLQELGALNSFLGLDGTNTPGLSRPPLWRAAQTLSQALEQAATHDGALTVQIQLRYTSLQYWDRVDSLDALRQSAESLLVIYQRIPRGKIPAGFDVRESAYRALMRVAFFTQPESMGAVAERARTAALKLGFGDTTSATMSVHQIIDKLSPIGKDWDPAQRDTAPAFHAVRWYPPPVAQSAGSGGGTSTGSRVVVDTTLVLTGTPSLLVQGRDAQSPALVRKWRARYSPQQLTVTMVDVSDDTLAYWTAFDQGKPELMMSGPFTVAERSDKARWYYQDFERLPVSVAVRTRHVEFPPFPRNQRTNANDNMPLGSMTLIDRRGKVLWQGMVAQAPIWFDRLLAFAVAPDTPMPASAHP